MMFVIFWILGASSHCSKFIDLLWNPGILPCEWIQSLVLETGSRKEEM